MSFNQTNSMKNIHKLSIAPMMDCTDKHFRMIMRQISAEALLYTEMIVAQSLVYTNRKEKFLDLIMKNILYQFSLVETILNFIKRRPKWHKIGVMTR